MKKLKFTVIAVILLMGFSKYSIAQTRERECNQYHTDKKSCSPSTDDFNLNGQSRSARMYKGQKSSLNVIFHNEQDYRITIYQGYGNTGDLYDLKKDPNELANLWNDKNYKEIRDNLVYKMFHEILNLQDHFPKKQAQA